jgi:hypothetical protein
MTIEVDRAAAIALQTKYLQFVRTNQTLDVTAGDGRWRFEEACMVKN